MTFAKIVTPDQETYSAFCLCWGKTEDVWGTYPQDRKAVVTHMIGCLHDGMAYGNWPVVR